MSTKEYAGDDLGEIRAFFMQDNEIRYTELVEDKGAEGFTLSTENDEDHCGWDNRLYVVVWPRASGGYWCEEY